MRGSEAAQADGENGNPVKVVSGPCLAQRQYGSPIYSDLRRQQNNEARHRLPSASRALDGDARSTAGSPRAHEPSTASGLVRAAVTHRQVAHPAKKKKEKSPDLFIDNSCGKL